MYQVDEVCLSMSVCILQIHNIYTACIVSYVSRIYCKFLYLNICILTILYALRNIDHIVDVTKHTSSQRKLQFAFGRGILVNSKTTLCRTMHCGESNRFFHRKKIILFVDAGRSKVSKLFERKFRLLHLFAATSICHATY